jgi:Ala-tRNA(Pro) deacylase
MPQRRKRAAARKGKQKRAKTPKKKTAKHLPVKTMPKKRAGKAKPRTAKKAAARKSRPQKQQGEAPAERQTMGIAITLAQYLGDRGVAYDLVPHPRTVTTSASAAASRVAADSLAKAVVLKRGDGFMLAVLPASCHIQFEELRRLFGSDLDMANEEQVETLFLDCERGAVPALGAAYGLNVVVDDSLAQQPDVYFEGGDHANLVHISGTSFQKLMADARYGRFSGRA